LGIKITMTFFYFRPQNQAGYGLSAAPQNQREDEDGVGHALRSSGLLRVEASRDMIFQSGLKTGGGVKTGGARDIIVEVIWGSSQRRMS
jgi:hypothetical protein